MKSMISKKVDPTIIPVLNYQKTIYLNIFFIKMILGIYLFIVTTAPAILIEYVSLMTGFFLVYRIAVRGRTYLAFFIALILLIADVFVGIINFGLESGTQYYLLTMCTLLSASPRLNKGILTALGISTLGLFFIITLYFNSYTPFFPLEPGIMKILFNFNLLVAFFIIIISLWRFTSDLLTKQKEISEYHDEIFHIAHTDALTGLANRNAIQNLIPQSFEKAQKSGQNLLLGLMDVDNFKNVNDTFGHNCGDEALKLISSHLQKSLRQGDHVGRWGGEEFLIIMMTNDPNSAENTFQRIRRSIQETPIQWEGKQIFLSITLGYTEYQKSDTSDSAISRADKFLYIGKNTGKNKIVSDLQGHGFTGKDPDKDHTST